MESSRPRPAAKSNRRMVRVLAGVTGLFVIGLVAVWWHMASDEVVITVPTPVMPNPNAFDFYVAAGAGVVSTKQIDNASLPKPTTPLSLEQKEAILQQNAGVLKSLHQGFAYEFRNPPARSFAALFPYLTNFRRIARLLALQSKVRAARGDWSGAADSALDAVRMGEDMPHGGVVIAQLVGNGCEAIGQRPMWETVEHLNAAQARAAAQRLEAIMEKHFSYADTMQEEKWMGQAGLKEVLRSVTMNSALKNGGGLIGTGQGDVQRYKTAFYLLSGKKRILQNYTALMDAAIAQARQPYNAKLPPLPVPSDPITREMAPTYEGARLAEVKAETQNGLLLIALGLRAYRLEKGRYPASLAELAPTYLKKLPPDLFALQGGLQYRLEGQKYVLYSIGPDGKDDGGRPIDDPRHASVANPKARYRIEPESQGDIVMGINNY